MSDTFTYTIYVKATPAAVWRALTEPDLTRRYWRHVDAGPKTFGTDWKKGSTWDLIHADVGLVVSDPEQVVLEAEPGHQLSYTWHSFTPQWATEVGLDEATAAEWRSEPRSTVTYDLEEATDGVTALTISHGPFDPDSPVLEAISQGWPAVFSSLKTVLETGEQLSTS